MSSTWALKMPTSLRSVSSWPTPTCWRPVKRVSAPFTVIVSGASPSASSLTRAQVEHQPEPGRVGRLARRLEDPELQELVAGEIQARWC